MFSLQTRDGRTVKIDGKVGGSGIWVECDGMMTFITATELAASAAQGTPATPAEKISPKPVGV